MQTGMVADMCYWRETCFAAAAAFDLKVLSHVATIQAGMFVGPVLELSCIKN